MLRVWLPLTKDLRNQGLDDVTVMNNGATLNSAGKLGGCYYFNRSTPNYLKITNPLTTATNGVSMAFWVKLPSNGSVNDQLVHIGNGSGWTNNRFTCFVRGGNSTLIFACGDGTNSTQYGCTSSALTLNQWTHVACLYESNKMKIYLNGVLDKEYSTTIVPSFTNVSYIGIGAGPNITEPATAYLNDIRIYDHCLSPMEVKELAKGLVLHYPLNRGGWGQENLLLNGGDLTKWNIENGVEVNFDAEEQMYKIVDTTHSNDSRWGIYQNFQVLPNTTYTFSIEGKAGTSNTTAGIFTYESSTAWPSPVYTFTTTKSKCIHTFTTGSNHTVGRVYLGINTSSGNKTAWYKYPKLELGSIATPWCPNSSDALATTMGLNGTTEHDCSGFCNNGTRTGTPIYTSDTPKYVVSTQFTGTQYILSESPTTNGATLAAWVKTTSTSNQALVIDYKSGLGIGFWSSYIVPSCNSAIKTTYPNSAYHVNEWNHIVIVKNSSSSILCYVNGELQNAGSTQDYWSTGVIDGFSIAARPNGASPSTCQISDVRIYATALSADDVKSLYQNSAYIDSSGNVYGAVH